MIKVRLTLLSLFETLKSDIEKQDFREMSYQELDIQTPVLAIDSISGK